MGCPQIKDLDLSYTSVSGKHNPRNLF